MEIGESVAIPGGAWAGSGKDDGIKATLVDARWEHTDDRKQRERARWADLGDEVRLLADAQQGFAEGDTVVFLLYDDDRRFAAATGKIEGGTARATWVVRTKEPGKPERVRAVRLTFEASGKGALTERAQIPLRSTP